MTPQEMQADAAARLGATWRGQAQFQPPATRITLDPTNENPAADGLLFSEPEVRTAIDDPRKLPQDQSPLTNDDHSEASPSVPYAILVAAAIVMGAGAFGAATSWIMAHLPKDPPHPAYVAELRHR